MRLLQPPAFDAALNPAEENPCLVVPQLLMLRKGFDTQRALINRSQNCWFTAVCVDGAVLALHCRSVGRVLGQLNPENPRAIKDPVIIRRLIRLKG